MNKTRTRRILLVDNYDSYTFNIFHLLASEMGSGVEPIVVQNDDFDGNYANLLLELGEVDGIVIGPGPGDPNRANTLGLSKSILAHRSTSQVPILGICLGMQAIALEYGWRVVKAPVPMHGRLSQVVQLVPCELFTGVDFPLHVVRYHSLCVEKTSSEDLVITSVSQTDHVAMSLKHRTKPIFAVQFHPESICAGNAGRQLVGNFLRLCGSSQFTIPLQLANPKPIVGIVASEKYKLLAIKLSSTDKTGEELFFDSGLFNHSGRMWLDSSSGLERGSRFSVLCSSFGPVMEQFECFVLGKRMRAEDTNLELSKIDACTLRVNGTQWVFGRDPFTHLSDRVNAYRPVEVELTFKGGEEVKQGGFELLPFSFACGFVGVLGYGLRKLCGVKPAVIPANVEYVPHPDAVPDAALFLASRAVVVDHSDGDAVYVLTLVNGECATEQAEWTNAVAKYLSPSASASKRPRVTPQSVQLVSNRSESEYELDVETCLGHIRNGESYEICLTNQVKGTVGVGSDLRALYCTIREFNPAPLSAYFDFAPKLAILSSSPERFISVDAAGVVQSRPIKGTCKRSKDPEQDLLLKQQLVESEKERAENLMIIDLVRNDLGRVCEVGSVQVPDLIVCESFSTVHQLVSTIRGQLKPEYDAVEACRACFPPGSMTGAPKLRTMQLIDSIELEERGFYSGSLGYFSLSGAADLSVLIRTAVVVDGTEVSIGAGGAVVAMSSAPEERKEMQLKLQTLGETFDITF
ncbi:hypothetical protein BASA81_010773 [Batrachochytrium salamandrivorans]|nr:hypothetical protein BASA81_010773 [Batrachochytrium salamandrivorans]